MLRKILLNIKKRIQNYLNNNIYNLLYNIKLKNKIKKNNNNFLLLLNIENQKFLNIVIIIIFLILIIGVIYKIYKNYDIIIKKIFYYFYKDINFWEHNNSFSISLNRNNMEEKIGFPSSFYLYKFYKYCLKINKIDIVLNPYLEEILDMFLNKITNPEKLNKAIYLNFIDLLFKGLRHKCLIDDDVKAKIKAGTADNFEKYLEDFRDPRSNTMRGQFLIDCYNIRYSLNRDMEEFELICECINMLLFAEFDYIVMWLKYHYFNNNIDYYNKLFKNYIRPLFSNRAMRSMGHPYKKVDKKIDKDTIDILNKYYMEVKSLNSFILKVSLIIGAPFCSSEFFYGSQDGGFAKGLTNTLFKYPLFFPKGPLDLFKISDVYYDLKFFIEFFWKYGKDYYDLSIIIQDSKLLKVIDNFSKVIDKSLIGFFIYIIILKKGPIISNVMMSGFHGFFGLSYNFWYELLKKIPKDSQLRVSLLEALHKNNPAGFLFLDIYKDRYNAMSVVKNTKQIVKPKYVKNLVEKELSIMIEDSSFIATMGDIDQVARPYLINNYKDPNSFDINKRALNLRTGDEIFHTALSCIDKKIIPGPSVTSDGSGYISNPMKNFYETLTETYIKNGIIDTDKHIANISVKDIGPGVQHDIIFKDVNVSQSSEISLVLKPEINVQLKQPRFIIKECDTINNLLDFFKSNLKSDEKGRGYTTIQWELKSSKGVPLKFIFGTENIEFFFAGKYLNMAKVSLNEGAFNQELLDLFYVNDNVTFSSLLEKYPKGDVMFTVELYIQNHLNNNLSDLYPEGLEIRVGYGKSLHEIVNNFTATKTRSGKGSLGLPEYNTILKKLIK